MLNSTEEYNSNNFEIFVSLFKVTNFDRVKYKKIAAHIFPIQVIYQSKFHSVNLASTKGSREVVA